MNISISNKKELKLFLLLITALISSFFFSVEAYAQCEPASRQVAFFQHSNFQGKCVIKEVKNYPNSSEIGMANDSISSIKIGTEVQAFVCKDSFFRGGCEVLIKDYKTLRNNTVKGDKISSAKIQLRGSSIDCVPDQNQVAFYQDGNYKGACEVRGLGKYNDSLKIGLKNDTISSIKVGTNVQVVICRDSNYRGHCIVLKKDRPTLKSWHVGNDEISSAKVQALGIQECEPGRDQVAFFMHSAFIAPCIVKGMGAYRNSSRIGLKNDSISSVLVGGDAQVLLCKDSNYIKCKLLKGNQSNLKRHIGHDQVSSSKVQPAGFEPCVPNANQASFFADADFVGSCIAKDIGDYKNSSNIGLPDDSISSIRVGSSVQVCACGGEDFTQLCETFTMNDPSLSNNFPTYTTGNDFISSVKVQARGAECKAEPKAPVPQEGYNQIDVVNCHTENRTVHLWVQNLTTGATYVEKGTLSSQYSNGDCPNGVSPHVISLKDGDLFEFVIVDPGLLACDGNNPSQSPCQRTKFNILGDANGMSYVVTEF